MSSRDPFKDLLSIQERVNRLFDDAVGSGVTGLQAGTTWSPAVDICETETEFLVSAEVPEVRRSDVDITVKDGSTLIIEGERRPRRTEMEGYYRLERAYGRFRRSFLLPDPVDQDSITASLKDGILKIVLPKKRKVAKKKRGAAAQG